MLVWVTTLATLGSGLANLFSVVGPSFAPRHRILREFFPLEFLHVSRSITLLIGFALVISSINIYRRKKRAYYAVLALSGLSVVFHLTKGLDFEEAAFSAHMMRPRGPLYGYLVLFLSTKVIDMVLEGWNYSKLVIITSSRTEEIADYILRGLDRSGTALRSRSLYLNREGELILTVIHRKQLADLRNFIKKTDPEAFVIINDTYDVLGKGFKSHLIT